MNRGALALSILITAGYVNPARGQASPTTLVVELKNVVEYQVDTTDLSKWGTNPNITQGSIAQGKGVGCVGVPVVGYGDIVSVNGQPARGSWAVRGTSVCMRPSPTAGVYVIADTNWNSKRDETFEILQSDGITPVGTIMTIGLNSGSPTPPGPPAGNQNYAIVGGTGAFFGARGQKGARSNLLSDAIPERTASITEDPAKRRQNGGGHVACRPIRDPDVAAGHCHYCQRSRRHAFQRLLTRKRLQARDGGRDSVSVRYRPRSDPHQPHSRPAVPIESSGGRQFAH